MNNPKKQAIFTIVAIFVAMTLLNSFSSLSGAKKSSQERNYSQFLDAVKNDEVQSVVFNNEEFRIDFTNKSGKRFFVYNPEPYSDAVVPVLRDHNVEISAKERYKEGILTKLILSVLPILLILGIIIYFSRQMQGGGKGGAGPLSFGKSKARRIDPDKTKITFKDVAGIDEVKEDLVEMVDYLKDPAKFNRLGGKIPRGVLMVGEPGTGKTLLAKAVAGEAKVPFFSISGSDFVEMFVGVGAARVRDMFAEAKKNAPCIIFIDEIDAVGRHRGAGTGGGNDEREQTLNQLLVEMDGFEGNEGIIIIAATNRADVLDKALLRPGRFDRQVPVPLPDVRGRFEILKVHMKKVPLDMGVKPKILARGTPGFSGAELANLVNEAALCAARRDSKTVTMKDFEMAKDRILMGAERRSMAMSEDEKLMTAYHEAGHAIVGHLVPKHDPVYKVTIIPRGRALGVTMYLPERDKYSMSKIALESSLASLFGGRIAEAIIYGEDEVTTGASNDIARATSIARNMVVKWGLSEKLGPQMFTKDEHGDELKASGETIKVIDEEVRRILDENYEKAEKILRDNEDILHNMAKALMKYETIDSDQIDDLMARRPVRAADYDDEDDDLTSAEGLATENEPTNNGSQEELSADEKSEDDK